jgi:hypothetical protein
MKLPKRMMRKHWPLAYGSYLAVKATVLALEFNRCLRCRRVCVLDYCRDCLVDISPLYFKPLVYVRRQPQPCQCPLCELGHQATVR